VDRIPLGEANVLARVDPFARPVLALDLGTSLGFALRTSACIASGTLKLPDRRNDHRGFRLLRLWRWLHAIHAATPLDLVAYELVQFMGPMQRLAAGCYAEYQGCVLMFCARNEIPVKSVNVATLKKAITGRGNHPKGEGKAAMANAVRGHGFTPLDDNESDALGVLIWATR
jgi:crossover junction endodeoxyribonuclease RuvC